MDILSDKIEELIEQKATSPIMRAIPVITLEDLEEWGKELSKTHVMIERDRITELHNGLISTSAILKHSYFDEELMSILSTNKQDDNN